MKGKIIFITVIIIILSFAGRYFYENPNVCSTSSGTAAENGPYRECACLGYKGVPDDGRFFYPGFSGNYCFGFIVKEYTCNSDGVCRED
jgi:hypothetical protein